MRRKSKSSLNFNDHETGHGGAEKNPLLDGSGNANNNKDTNNDNKNATIEGEADWIFYGRMKIIHQKIVVQIMMKKIQEDVYVLINV